MSTSRGMKGRSILFHLLSLYISLSFSLSLCITLSTWHISSVCPFPCGTESWHTILLFLCSLFCLYLFTWLSPCLSGFLPPSVRLPAVQEVGKQSYCLWALSCLCLFTCLLPCLPGFLPPSVRLPAVQEVGRQSNCLMALFCLFVSVFLPACLTFYSRLSVSLRWQTI